MKLFRSITLLGMTLVWLYALGESRAENTAVAQPLPYDVGLVTELSGNITYWNEDYQKTPARAQAFMKIRKGDRFNLPPGAQVQLVYFLGGRQETWKGPVAILVGDSESQPEGEDRPETWPKVKVLPAGTTQGVRRIPAILRRAGLSRPGAAQVRGNVEATAAPLELTAEEQAEITAARETYHNLRKQAGARDITPELYLLGILADYEQYAEMEEVIQEALKKQPGNETLKGLREWAQIQSSQSGSPSSK